MFDVDLFKEINDQYGHLAGDQVLKEIANRCGHIIRHVDIFGRYGGDEFVILLPETDQTMARDIADRIRTSIGESAMITEVGPIMVTISLGVPQATQDTMDLDL